MSFFDGRRGSNTVTPQVSRGTRVMNYARDLGKPTRMGQAYTRGLDRIAGRGFGAAKSVMGNYLASDVLIRSALNVFTHDSSQGSFSDHMAKESFKMIPDIAADYAIFKGITGGGKALGTKFATSGAGKRMTRSLMKKGMSPGMMRAARTGGKAGLFAAAIGTFGAIYGNEVNPGSFVGNLMDNAAEKYNEQKYGRGGMITQNKRTMAAMQKSMNLLGQSRPQSSLGQEAQLMHN